MRLKMSADYSNPPRSDKALSPAATEADPVVYDLRGVRCPLNWARAKVRLEGMPKEAVLVVRLDDPKGVRDLPRAAEAAGYAVLDVVAELREWRIVIQK